MEQEPARIRLVAGLGNPGSEYDGTRHNIGFMVLDRLAAQSKLPWEASKKWGAWWTKDETILVKPATYMNRSGEPLSAIAQFYKIAAEEILIVLDDLALPLGRLRLRLDGSSGGHNGLESVIEHFGTDQVKRLRIGIGAAPHEDAKDYVLGRFFEEEKKAVENAVQRASDAVKCALEKGALAAMNIFNKAEGDTL